MDFPAAFDLNNIPVLRPPLVPPVVMHLPIYWLAFGFHIPLAACCEAAIKQSQEDERVSHAAPYHVL